MFRHLPATLRGLVADSVLLSIALVAATAVAVAGLVLQTAGHQDALQGNLRDALLLTLPVTLAIMFAGAALTYLLTRGVRRSARLLTAAAARLVDGDFSTPVPSVTEPELSPLAEQLEAARAGFKAHLEAVASAEARHAEMSGFREQLLYSVAHELRGPLSVLENSMDILSTEYGDLSIADFDRMMHSSRRTVIRLHSMMEELLSAGSIQAGRFQVQPGPADLPAILAEALDLVEPMLESRGQWVQLPPADDRSRVLADRRYLRQVLSNLLSNASKYSPEGTAIQVEVERTEGQVRISVRDSGPGISSEQRIGLFERFYRVRGSSEQPGIGLGLAIAKGIVDAHGGSIGVDSEVGAGTTIWLTLPTAPEEGQ